MLVLGTGLSCLPDPDLPASSAVFPTPRRPTISSQSFCLPETVIIIVGACCPWWGAPVPPPTSLLPVQFSPCSPRPGQSTPLLSRHLCHCPGAGRER